VWDTNLFGVLAVYQAMLPLLRQAPGARILHGCLGTANDRNHQAEESGLGSVPSA
jgi:NAD(P)-dependent dehydrogenase (short-subunit alcohol dehydrogenase family)